MMGVGDWDDGGGWWWEIGMMGVGGWVGEGRGDEGGGGGKDFSVAFSRAHLGFGWF
jgi:hypothetical protein